MVSGGLFIAIVGGDGAGKTTLVDELFRWLSEKFEVEKLHMGKPRWSWITIALRGLLKIGTTLRLYRFEGDIYEESFQAHGLPWFIRAACTARDRYLTYLRGRRLSSNGKLVICDRFSFPGFMQMDGPECLQALTYLKKAGWFHNLLTRIELSYYEQIKLPDLLIILKVDPEIAVRRKNDESEVSTYARTTEVWNLDWREKTSFVLDANLPKEEVLAQARAIVWSHL
jgi:thymidylate kinase